MATVEEYGRWLAGSSVPKLFISADPGSLLIGRAREFCRTRQNQIEVGVQGLTWEYPRKKPDGDQMDFVEVMEIENGLRRHCVYWGWYGVRLLEENRYRQ